VYKVNRLTRSLADFAKLIELFDAHEVSFVSVTHSFNTTNSMGRLTLNILLSFAQFDREVIGERVRDKIAALTRRRVPDPMWTMTAQSTRSAEAIRKIAGLALSDASEITLLIGLIRGLNTESVTKKLNEAGAGSVAEVIRNALMARLVLLIARAYAQPPWQHDPHLQKAACLLKDNPTRQIFGTINGYDKLAAFDKQWDKCHGDPRLPGIKNFRDKFTAHFGEPKDIPLTTYTDLFAFGAETAKAMELLALAIGFEVLDTDPDFVSTTEEKILQREKMADQNVYILARGFMPTSRGPISRNERSGCGTTLIARIGCGA
jgi:hypothetical protein